MLLADRREMPEEGVGHIFDLASSLYGLCEIACVPKDDGGDQEIQAGGTMFLVLEGPVADFVVNRQQF